MSEAKTREELSLPWEMGAHPAMPGTGTIRPIMFGRRVGKLHECEGGHAYFVNGEIADFIVTAANAHHDLLEALSDMLSGWAYIRERHGDLPGVGWDRAEAAARAALAKAKGGA
jgi:hypothetical protein